MNVKESNLEQLNLQLEWTFATIQANSEKEMELVWSPITDGTIKHTLFLTDNRNFKKDVCVILKAVPLKIKVNLQILL